MDVVVLLGSAKLHLGYSNGLFVCVVFFLQLSDLAYLHKVLSSYVY